MRTLEMRDVSVIRNGKRILDSIDLCVEDGESAAVIGMNGSGKTTLMKLIRGDILPYYNEESPSVMRIFGEDNWNIFDVRSRMGVVSMDLQNQFGSGTLVREVIASGFFGSLDVFRNMKVTEEMLSKVENAALMMGIEDLLNREVEGLSVGELRRAMIARALVTEPRALVMDEPMTGLDIVMASKFRKMFDILIEAGVSLIIVTHDLADIPKSIGRVIMMKGGKIFADGKKEVLFTSETMSGLYDEPINVECVEGIYHMRL
ncbi:MAG: ATP-binding cassette domain-containing protein [Candidatus Methanoplasma sp.]|jgi:iron complex transport system ATP-binding protein|nr:ATP-binding cassette domain-containing protein [Candidatus Methanoplasma sp.]